MSHELKSVQASVWDLKTVAFWLGNSSPYKIDCIPCPLYPNFCIWMPNMVLLLYDSSIFLANSMQSSIILGGRFSSCQIVLSRNWVNQFTTGSHSIRISHSTSIQPWTLVDKCLHRSRRREVVSDSTRNKKID